MADFLHDRVVAERRKIGDVSRNIAVDGFDVSAAKVDVTTKSADLADLDGVVEFPIFVEGGPLGLVHGAEDEFTDLVGVEGE